MKFIRKGISYKGKEYHFVFEEEKKIFMLTWKKLINKRERNLKGDFDTTNIQLPLLLYCDKKKYSILCIYKKNKIKFIFNPLNYSEIKDISPEFYDFITKNYDKI